MNIMQRQFGRLTTRGAGEDSEMSLLLHDFDNADTMLTKIIDASKAWRESWISILEGQFNIVSSFDDLYNPIVGATSDWRGHEPVPTSDFQLERSSALKVVYADLKADLLEEVNMMESRVVRPASDAKSSIQPVKKTIKKRENKRLDYERYQDRVNNATKKQKRSDRENAALAKSEQELAKAEEDFKTANDHLRKCLPPIISAAFSILPLLLNGQIMIQNSLLAQYYTALHNYCTDKGFPSPPPPMTEVISQWETLFKPVQHSTESLNCIARGKAVHSSMQLGEDETRRGSATSGRNFRPGLATRRTSSQQATTSGGDHQAGRPTMRATLSDSKGVSQQQATPSHNDADYLSPPASDVHLAHSPAGPTRDYFNTERSTLPSNSLSSAQGSSQLVKKKPPPPPPPKRIPSDNSIFVTAIYDFHGQERGDLTFREGDRIRVVKKSDTTDDWWDGELNGVKGRFPANYCES